MKEKPRRSRISIQDSSDKAASANQADSDWPVELNIHRDDSLEPWSQPGKSFERDLRSPKGMRAQCTTASRHRSTSLAFILQATGTAIARDGKSG